MKLKLAVFFILLGVAVPESRATIGDTEEQVIAQRPAALHVAKSKIDNRAYVIQIIDSKTWYAAGVLDGKVEVETFMNVDDSKLEENFVVPMLKSYAEIWYPTECDEHSCVAAMSADLKYYAKLGVSKALKKNNVLTVFSRTWGEYAKSRQQGVSL